MIESWLLEGAFKHEAIGLNRFNRVGGPGAAPGYKVIDKIKIGGPGNWDYVYIDSDANRLYVSHGTQTEVIDTAANKLAGTIPDTAGVHGIAVANDLGKGFTSNGRTNNVTVFDLKTLMATGTIATGMNPDAILYDPVSHRCSPSMDGATTRR